MTEAIHAVIGERLRPAYELTEEENAAEDAGSGEMTEDDLIEMLKTNFDAHEVEADEARESEAR